jgi:hypothetical protein
MKGHIDPKQEKAVNALLSHPTQKEAANSSRIPLSTIEKWLTQPEFKQALHEAEIEIYKSTGRGLMVLQEPALKALKEVLEDSQQPGGSLKFKAAIKILELGNRYFEIAEIDARVRVLEEKASHAL